MEKNNENITKLNEIFNLFVSREDLRPSLLKPFELNNKIYASDAYSLIRMNKEYCDFNITNTETPPNCESVIPQENLNLLLDVNKDLFEQYRTADEYKLVGKDVECKTCDGYGEVEWEFESYTKDFDCPVCNGDGYEQSTKKVKTGGKTFEEDLVKLKNSYLLIANFYKLMEVKEKLNEPIYLIHQTEPNKSCLFRIGVCEILIMPYMYSDTFEGKIIDLNI